MASGKVGVEIYTRGSSLLGMLPDIESAEVEESINQIGQFSFTVAMDALNSTLLVVGREISLLYEGEGEVFRGVIDIISTSTVDDSQMLVVQGSSLAIELFFTNVWRGIVLNNVSATVAYSTILTNTSPAWSALLTSITAANIRRRFDDASLFQAAQDLARLCSAYTRETSTLRQLEVKTTYTASGFRLINQEMVTAELVSSIGLGLITSLELVVDSTELWNRIIPFAKADGDTYSTLQTSSRTTPYTIQSRYAVSPNVTGTFSVDATLENGNGGQVAAENGDTAFNLGSVACEGDNRIALVWIKSGQYADAFERPQVSVLSVGGVPATVVYAAAEQRSIAGQTTFFDYFQLWLCVNPPIGDSQISGVKSLNCGISVFAIALRDADTVTPLTGGVSGGSTSNVTTASITQSGLSSQQLVIAGIYANSRTVSPTGTGQVAFSTGFGHIGVTYRLSPPAGPVSSWSWTTSNRWQGYAVAVNPALCYYIEDATSIATYGVRERPLPCGNVDPVFLGSRVYASNIVYDEAVDHMEKHKDPLYSYKIALDYLPGTARQWNIGDSFILSHRQPDIDATLICVSRKSTYDTNGVRHWALELSTVERMASSMAETISSAIERLNAIQSLQV